VQILRTHYSVLIFSVKNSVPQWPKLQYSNNTGRLEKHPQCSKKKMMIKPSYLEFKSPRATSPSAQTSVSQRPDHYIFITTVSTYSTANKPPHLGPTEKVLTFPLSTANMHSLTL